MRNKKKGILIIGVIVLSLFIFFCLVIYLINLENKKENSENQIEQMDNTEQMDNIEKVDELWEELKFSSVQIKGENLYGSGSIYDIDEEKIYLVSNNHLTIYIMNPIVVFFDGSTAVGVSTKNSEQVDMGILEVNKSELPIETLDEITKIHFTEETVQITEEMVVYALGSAEGLLTSKVVGTVVNAEEYHPEFHSFMVRCTGSVHAGMSGAGVFDMKGNYIGMVSGAKDEEFVYLPVEIMKEEEFFGGIYNDEN